MIFFIISNAPMESERLEHGRNLIQMLFDNRDWTPEQLAKWNTLPRLPPRRQPRPMMDRCE